MKLHPPKIEGLLEATTSARVGTWLAPGGAAMRTNRSILSISLLTAAMSACSAGPSFDGDIGNDPPLAKLDEIKAGAPKADEIPRVSKADELLPSRYDDLRELQSPVKSQGRRGVCSIFSTVALMEHLYIAEGSITDPDFSEQYLQWSAKFQVGSFPNSSGSNAGVNLEAINRFGIVTEDAWPYEIDQWGTSDDAECDGEDDQPTRCYTNGEPPATAVDADKFKLPRGRWLHPLDIKSHLYSQHTGVVVGLTFFYQSWNHRKSPLPTNSSYWDQGYVLYPNAADEEASLEEDMQAGHSILLIGWDDDLEVQTVDKDGNKVVDANGQPVMEKGFYIFKNSWGTSGFGIDNDLGAGYGYISYRYVQEYGSARISGLPDLGPRPEVCGDGRDNDNNGATDCADAACFGDAACGGSGSELVFENVSPVSIPDNDRFGVTSEIEVDAQGTAAAVAVDVDIDHTYQGDLTVSLVKDGTSVVLHDRTGGSNDDLKTTFVANGFDGVELGGTWQLMVVDSANADVGVLNSWRLRIIAE